MNWAHTLQNRAGPAQQVGGQWGSALRGDYGRVMDNYWDSIDPKTIDKMGHQQGMKGMEAARIATEQARMPTAGGALGAQQRHQAGLAGALAGVASYGQGQQRGFDQALAQQQAFGQMGLGLAGQATGAMQQRSAEQAQREEHQRGMTAQATAARQQAAQAHALQQAHQRGMASAVTGAQQAQTAEDRQRADQSAAMLGQLRGHYADQMQLQMGALGILQNHMASRDNLIANLINSRGAAETGMTQSAVAAAGQSDAWLGNLFSSVGDLFGGVGGGSGVAKLVGSFS